MVNVKKVAIFVGGMLFGSAGFKILASKDAKKVYTQTTAAVLRMMAFASARMSPASS